MRITVPKVGSIDIGTKRMVVIGVLVLGAPGASVYSDSVLSFLDHLLSILSDNAEAFRTFLGFGG